MQDFNPTDYLLQKECDQIAQDIFDDFKRDNPDDFDPEALRDDMTDRIHETVDGHQWVIYNYQSLKICANCDVGQGEEFLEDIGMPGDVTIYKLANMIVYGEMRARAEMALQELIDKASEGDSDDDN